MHDGTVGGVIPVQALRWVVSNGDTFCDGENSPLKVTDVIMSVLPPRSCWVIHSLHISSTLFAWPGRSL